MSSREPLFTPRFAALWAFAWVTFFSAFQLLPAIPFRILELGGDKAEAGWFLAVYTFASAFSAPIMGTVADHFGRRRTVVTASLLFIVFSVAYGVFTNLAVILVVGAIHGSLWSAILASSSALMSESIPESRRTEGMAYWGLASTTAVAVAPAVGLWVYQFGWLTLCLELAVLSVFMALGGLRLPHHDLPRPSVRLSISDAWDWRVIRTALSLSVIAFGHGGATSYAAILTLERGMKPASLYVTVSAATIVVLRIFTSRWLDRFAASKIIYASFLCAPVAMATLAFAQERWQIVLSAIVFGFGFSNLWPAFAAFMITKTDPRRRARTFGSILWAFDLGIGAGSLLIGAVGQRSGLAVAFGLAALVSCLSVPIFAFTSRRLESDGTSVAPAAEHARPG